MKSSMVRRNVYLGKSEAEHCYQTPHDDDDDICIKHSAVKLEDTWYEVSVPHTHGSKVDIVSSAGDKSAGGAELLVDKVLCSSTKTDEEVKQWIEDYETKYAVFDIIHNNSFHFCQAFVKWASDGNCNLRKILGQSPEIGEEAPENEFAFGGLGILAAMGGAALTAATTLGGASIAAAGAVATGVVGAMGTAATALTGAVV